MVGTSPCAGPFPSARWPLLQEERGGKGGRFGDSDSAGDAEDERRASENRGEMSDAPEGAGTGGLRPREFEGKSNREYRGDANGGGWRRWARAYILASSSLAPEARGPRLLNLMKEGSPAAKATRHLQPDQLAVPGGDHVLIEVLDKRYPKTPDHVNLREVMVELKTFDAYDGESAEALVGRFREAVGRAEAMDYRHSSKALGMMLIDSARLDTA